jgi:prepilin-type processing-associated H-X9-DG protein
MDDYDSYFYCPNVTTTSETAPVVMWSVRLKIDNYMPNYKAMFCTGTTYNTNQWNSYGAFFVNSNIAGFPAVSLKLPAFKKAGFSKINMLGCSWDISKNFPSFRMIFRNDITSAGYGRPYLIHNNRCNMLFADGHAASLGKNDLVNYESLQIWNGETVGNGAACDQSGTFYYKLY